VTSTNRITQEYHVTNERPESEQPTGGFGAPPPDPGTDPGTDQDRGTHPVAEPVADPVADTVSTLAGGGAATSQDPAAADVEEPISRIQLLEQEGDIAADYLEELLDIADLDGDLDMDVEGDRAAVSVVGADLSQLVGRDGEVLEALQELTRLAVYRETGERSRLMLDISGYRADKRASLEKLAAGVVAQVQESGERAPLAPMTPFERKVVHDVVAAAGLRSESEGEEPHRYVVVLPAQ
jgi:spoIIIJ-associated protein